MSNSGPRHRSGVSYEENHPGSDCTDDEREFLLAMDRYKHVNRRPYPTWREVLRVLRALGWRKVAAAGGAADPSPSPPAGEGEGRGGR
jgi:hypothetical protein